MSSHLPTTVIRRRLAGSNPPNRAPDASGGRPGLLPLGAPLSPERAPGENPLQRMAAVMRDQQRRLEHYRQLGLPGPRQERARAVTMLRVATQASAVLPFAQGELLGDANAFVVARAGLRSALLG